MIFMILVGLVIGLLGWLAYKCHNPPGLAALVGMPRLPETPIVGCVTEFIGKSYSEMAELTWQYAEDLGSPHVSKVLNDIHVVLSRADHVEILLKSQANINKSTEYVFVEPWLQQGLLLSTGSKWHSRRKLLTPAFHFQILKDFLPIFNEQAAILVQILAEKSNSNGGEPLDICKAIAHCTLDIICETAMGIKISAQTRNSDYVNAIQTYCEIVVDRSVFPWNWNDTIFGLTEMGKKSNHALAVLHQFTRKVIDDRELDKAMTNQSNLSERTSETDDTSFGTKSNRRLAFLDLLLDMKDKNQINDQGIREEVNTFMFEGHDTTASATTWAIFCIACHPVIQETLHQELVDVMGDRLEENPTADDLSHFKYMECVIKESQRIFPTVPWIGRCLEEPMKIEQYTIPKGIIANINVVVLHRDPKHFPNPKTFDPDRFSPENSEGRHPFAFVPFSAGPRNCIGQKFATLEEKTVLFHLIRAFRMTANQKFEDVRPMMTVVLRPSEPMCISFQRR